jgi:hypothetical protein
VTAGTATNVMNFDASRFDNMLGLKQQIKSMFGWSSTVALPTLAKHGLPTVPENVLADDALTSDYCPTPYNATIKNYCKIDAYIGGLPAPQPPSPALAPPVDAPAPAPLADAPAPAPLADAPAPGPAPSSNSSGTVTVTV